MGTFMSKHCSPVSYGTPLEKKSCANYGTPLNQEKKEHVPAEFKDPNFMKRLESLNPNTKKNIMDRIKKRDSLAIAKYGSIEAMKKMQIEAEEAMTPEERKRDDR
jgi:hypothetical protein